MSKSTFVKIIMLLLLIVSCNNKETKIKNVETLVNETKEKYETYNQKDWDRADTLIVALEMIGLAILLVNPLGPVQL